MKQIEPSDIERVQARIRAGWLLHMDDLVVVLGCCAKTIRRRISAGQFPAPDRRMNARVHAWFPKTVARFIGQK